MLLLGLYALIRNQITFKQQLSQFQQSKQIMANICADLCADYIGDKTAGKWIQMTFEQPLEATAIFTDLTGLYSERKAGHSC